MDDSQLQYFRALLQERMTALLADAELGDLEEAEVLDDVEDTEVEFALRLRDREKALVAKLRAAMCRIEDGDYGTCAACGGEISVARLLTRPTAIHCLDCRSSETLRSDEVAW